MKKEIQRCCRYLQLRVEIERIGIVEPLSIKKPLGRKTLNRVYKILDELLCMEKLNKTNYNLII